MKRTPSVWSAAVLAGVVALLGTLLAAGWLWSTAGNMSLQALGAWLTLPMRVFTFLGDEQFYLVAIPLVYWCIHKELGADLGVLLVLSSFVNGALKSTVKHPRPFWENPALKLADAGSFSTPSGHAQTSAALFGYLAWFLFRGRRGLLWVLLLGLLIVLVSLSRVYLGVHYVGDVIWGVAAGLLLVALYTWAKPRALPWLRERRLAVHAALAVVTGAGMVVAGALLRSVPVGLGGSFPELQTAAMAATLDESATVAGLVIGLWIGLVLESRHIRFVVAGPIWQRVVRYLVGVVGLFLIWFGLRIVLPEEPLLLGVALRVVRYALAMFWAIAVWPWLFVRLGLGRGEKEEAERGPVALAPQ